MTFLEEGNPDTTYGIKLASSMIAFQVITYFINEHAGTLNHMFGTTAHHTVVSMMFEK